MPDLNLTQVMKQKSPQYIQHFTNDVYLKYNWLCGCNIQVA